MSDNGVDETVPIAVRNLTRRFGTTLALSGVDLTVPRGCVFGLLGENGAGKTTLIKHLMGLLRPQSGSVGIFGRDPVKDPEGALGRIGYLSEDRDLPRWMKLHELMRYTAGFYPKWDPKFADELLELFDLDPRQKIKTCSLGQTAKVGLLVALAHRPDLVVLDEPSSGLDALVRRQILHSAIRHVAEEGRTVLFSSHLLDEVERVSDYVAIMNAGEVLLCDRLETIRAGHRFFRVSFREAQENGPEIAGALSCEGSGREWSIVFGEESGAARASIESAGATILEERPPSLEEIFLARIGSKMVKRGVA